MREITEKLTRKSNRLLENLNSLNIGDIKRLDSSLAEEIREAFAIESEVYTELLSAMYNHAEDKKVKGGFVKVKMMHKYVQEDVKDRSRTEGGTRKAMSDLYDCYEKLIKGRIDWKDYEVVLEWRRDPASLALLIKSKHLPPNMGDKRNAAPFCKENVEKISTYWKTEEDSESSDSEIVSPSIEDESVKSVAATKEEPNSSSPQFFTEHLQSTGSLCLGRDEELHQLSQAIDDVSSNVIIIEAFGGAGKSTIVNRWLAQLATKSFDEPVRIVGWTFNDKEPGQLLSADEFIEYVFRYLGVEIPAFPDPIKRCEELYALVSEKATIIVLDGLESLQRSGMEGVEIFDKTLSLFVKKLAAKNNGLCVVTTRMFPSEVDSYIGSTVIRLPLKPLSSQAGASILKRLHVRGSEEELEEVSEFFNGHALALSLMSSLLTEYRDKDVRHWREADMFTTVDYEWGHAERVIKSYESWLHGKAELELLYLLCFFNRPAREDELLELKNGPKMEGLTEHLHDIDASSWRKIRSRLQRLRLISVKDEGATYSIDTHQIVRDYFSVRLQEKYHSAWIAGHSRLYSFYRGSGEALPTTVQEVRRLYNAMRHGFLAGKHKEVFDEVYKKLICQDKFYSTNKLGLYGEDLAAIWGFFENDWDKPVGSLSSEDQAWILSVAGMRLRAVGRLLESESPFKRGIEKYEELKMWDQAAIRAGNLSSLYLTQGELKKSVDVARISVKYAEESGDYRQRKSKNSRLAHTLHQCGDYEEPAKLFAYAEEFQKHLGPEESSLVTLIGMSGFFYCLFLLDKSYRDNSEIITENGEVPVDKDVINDVKTRANNALPILIKISNLHEIALYNLLLGLANTEDIIVGHTKSTSDAYAYLDTAVEGLISAGTLHHLPRAQIARARLNRITGAFDKAEKDLKEISEVIDRGHMRLFDVEVSLEKAMLFISCNDLEQAQECLDEVEKDINEIGYHRCDLPLELARRRLAAIS